MTGSHNPPDYNGFKIVVAGDAIYGDAIHRSAPAHREPTTTRAASGRYASIDIRDDYLQRIIGDVKLARPMKIVVDAGNGVAGALAPATCYRAMGCEVTELFCEVDGNFPNHHPDPAHPENLQDLIAAVQHTDAELGLAFDGDGDRLGVVTKDGEIIYPDRQLMLFAQDVLARNPGARSSTTSSAPATWRRWIRAARRQPLMWKTGHSLIKAKMRETGAPLAGEMSGHFFFKDRWYGFDDGMYAGARLLEILSRERDPAAVLNALPQRVSTPELQLELAEGENFALIDEAARRGEVRGRDAGHHDRRPARGIGRTASAWSRSSNTTPVVVMRFEGRDAAALARIQAEFRRRDPGCQAGRQCCRY